MPYAPQGVKGPDDDEDRNSMSEGGVLYGLTSSLLKCQQDGIS
jgi:hypothetical protein